MIPTAYKQVIIFDFDTHVIGNQLFYKGKLS